MESTTAQQTLFDRLGGTEGITVLVDDIVAAHMVNPLIGPRFQPYKDDPENLAVIKQHLVEFISMGTGGDVEYSGEDMQSAHRGMNIDDAEYMAAIDDIMGVLDKHDIDEQSQKDMLAIAYNLRGDITRQ